MEKGIYKLKQAKECENCKKSYIGHGSSRYCMDCRDYVMNERRRLNKRSKSKKHYFKD